MTAASVMDLFRIGIGPSSSHTVGPMRAAALFAEVVGKLPLARIAVSLHGSLGATGRGHQSDRAVQLGLVGLEPETARLEEMDAAIARIRERGCLIMPSGIEVPFDPDGDLTFRPFDPIPGHPNGLRFSATLTDGAIVTREYLSVGGGFVTEVGSGGSERGDSFPFPSADELLAVCGRARLPIWRLVLEHESGDGAVAEVSRRTSAIWEAMQECVEAGLRGSGVLPGVLRVPRRAPDLHRRLLVDSDPGDPLRVMDWVSVWALAVNEENAAGHRVVTAPTNGAAGIIPAVLHLARDIVPGFDATAVLRFLLTAGAIGMLIKQRASISGADVGCQGEIGSASAMAAGGLAELLGGTPAQIENAAEIGLEHNLGLTCDPVAGLVQIPCIERNAVGAVKAVTAARIAVRGDGSHKVSLDQAIRTMRQTGFDMRSEYKETSRGGLAVNVVEC